MSDNFNILEFAGLSEDQPWELSEPIPTDLRAIVATKNCPTLETIGKAIATFVGEPIDAEKIDPPEDDIPWAMRVGIVGLPTDILLWAEPLSAASSEAANLQAGWVIALQTVLHKGDPLTHFSNLMRVLAGAELHVHSICDLATGRWFPRTILEGVFMKDDVEAPEEVLWITRLSEAPEDVEPEVISDIYFMAWQKKLKGVTIYRDGSRFPILSVENKLTKFQTYKDKKFEILDDEGEKIIVTGDHVMKSEDGRLTTLYHYINSETENQSNINHNVKTKKLQKSKNA